jgi:hypothetical protein
MIGRRRRDGNLTPQKNNSIQYSVENEENGYPVPDPNKAMKISLKIPAGSQKINPQSGNLGRNQ